MARSNGPFGPPETRPPLRRDSLSTLPVSQPAAQWPTQPYADHGQPAQAGPAYHFPPAEPAADYGYNQQPYAQPQWGQTADPRGYGVASYLPADPPPFQQTAHHHQQGYADADADYADEFYEDEEPRRSRRWILIAAALVGAIGVGGALAYTYRSLVAPNTRVPLVKAEPASSVKVRPDQRGGKEFPGADKKLLNRPEGTPAAAQNAEQEADGAEAAGGEDRNVGPKQVKTIPIGSQAAAVAPPPVTAVPGISFGNVGPTPRAEQPQAQPKLPPPATGRVSTGQPAAPAAEADEDDSPAPAAQSPIKRPQPAATPPPERVAVKVPSAPRATPPAASSGLGYVVVVASKKTHMDAFKAFADVAEKHPQVLNGKIPDVQEADLGEKGVTYRAVVGPPGSREAAMSLCNQLKAAGQDCWIKAF